MTAEGRGRPAPRPTAAVIGAGPHGLAAMAHLRHAGIDAHCFGEPLEFWRRQMPSGMILRSRDRSSNISDPRRALGIDRYVAATGRRVRRPSLTIEQFIEYGLWFQRQAVPDVDRRRVEDVTRSGSEFELRLSDGSTFAASRVIVAAGIAPFARVEAPFAGLPSHLVSHSSAHEDLSPFSGQTVAVIGSGQSALESAALLHEAGADVEVVMRCDDVRWLADADHQAPNPLLPPTDVGGRMSGWLAATPDVWRRLPREWGANITYRCIRPAGSGWLRPRLRGVALTQGRTVTQLTPQGDRVVLGLSDGSERTVDHVLLGTGYAVDVRRYSFLGAELTRDLATRDGYPLLRPGLESSITGLHFVGAPAALSFGPIMRFVVGTWYDAPAVARGVARRRQPPIRWSF